MIHLTGPMYAAAVILVIAAVTFCTRLAPFVLFSRGETPKIITYLGNALPPAVMAMLVVYCLRSTPILAAPHGVPELLAILTVVALHLWKRNNLISILCGTAVYMFLIQAVF
ncbi:branched-chain amino acid transporter permease [Bacilliculturomica massiliensis]|uniref:branched-chain amino acid transporter permease n=1 Tax=Bacilliculturomica massiliensis TaxID=1917867 RepID=UPI001A91DA32|nr:AzlD domain-containing protein [Bacilliculturomica massiliensis]